MHKSLTWAAIRVLCTDLSFHLEEVRSPHKGRRHEHRRSLDLTAAGQGLSTGPLPGQQSCFLSPALEFKSRQRPFLFREKTRSIESSSLQGNAILTLLNKVPVRSREVKGCRIGCVSLSGWCWHFSQVVALGKEVLTVKHTSPTIAFQKA